MVELERREGVEEELDLLFGEPDRGLGALVELPVGTESERGERVCGWGYVIEATPHFDSGCCCVGLSKGEVF